MIFSLVARFLWPRRNEVKFAFYLSIFSLTLAVALLTLTAGVITGFEKTLKQSVIEIMGDVMVVSQNSGVETPQQMHEMIQHHFNNDGGSRPTQFTAFLQSEALLVHKGQLRGVNAFATEDVADTDSVLPIRRLLTSPNDQRLGQGQVYVGATLAKTFGLAVGDTLSLVIPRSTRGGTQIERKSVQLQVAGILRMANHDADSRTVMMTMSQLLDLMMLTRGYSGLIYRIGVDQDSSEIANSISSEHYGAYSASSWRSLNRNLFDALELERPVLLIIVFIIAIAATFNLGSTLYIIVTQRAQEVAILRALGFRQFQIRLLFSLLGSFIGALAIGSGILIGMAAGQPFVVFLTQILEIPGDVYRINSWQIIHNPVDLAGVFFASMIICFFASYLPARHGASLSIVKGLNSD